MESEFFAPLAELASAVCKPKKTLENWTDADGKIKFGDITIQTIKIGGTRVVAREALNSLVLHLLQKAGVSPAAAARLVARQPADGNQEVTSQTPGRRGRPRIAIKKGGAA